MAVTSVLDPAVLENLARLNELVRPEAMARDRLLPVIPAFAELVPSGGLQRGWTIGTHGVGSVTMAGALAAEASQAGGWTAVVGLPGVNVAALADLGVALERTMFIHHPPPQRWADAVLAAAEGADVVLAGVPASLGGADARRVQARLSSRGAVLVLIGAGRQAAERMLPDIGFTGRGPVVWEGIGSGHGRLLARRVTVEAAGRRMPRALCRELWLPAADGQARLTERQPLQLAERTPRAS